MSVRGVAVIGTGTVSFVAAVRSRYVVTATAQSWKPPQNIPKQNHLCSQWSLPSLHSCTKWIQTLKSLLDTIIIRSKAPEQEGHKRRTHVRQLKINMNNVSDTNTILCPYCWHRLSIFEEMTQLPFQGGEERNVIHEGCLLFGMPLMQPFPTWWFPVLSITFWRALDANYWQTRHDSESELRSNDVDLWTSVYRRVLYFGSCCETYNSCFQQQAWAFIFFMYNLRRIKKIKKYG